MNYKRFRIGLKYFLTNLAKEYDIETIDYSKKERNNINTEYVSADCFGEEGTFTIDGSFDFNSFSLKLFNYIILCQKLQNKKANLKCQNKKNLEI